MWSKSQLLGFSPKTVPLVVFSTLVRSTFTPIIIRGKKLQLLLSTCNLLAILLVPLSNEQGLTTSHWFTTILSYLDYFNSLPASTLDILQFVLYETAWFFKNLSQIISCFAQNYKDSQLPVKARVLIRVNSALVKEMALLHCSEESNTLYLAHCSAAKLTFSLFLEHYSYSKLKASELYST